MHPIRCPGHPRCQKLFRYPSALKAHLLVCTDGQHQVKSKLQIPGQISYRNPDLEIFVFGSNSARNFLTVSKLDKRYLKGKHSNSADDSDKVEYLKSELAVKKNLNKGNVTISREVAMGNFMEKKYPTIHREYTSYWTVGELQHLSKVSNSRRDIAWQDMKHKVE